MDIQRLIKMANDIGAFFESEKDSDKGAAGVANHLKMFWAPQMRGQILDYVTEESGAGLKPLVLRALRSHRDEIGPTVR